jgi:hypothetical protein
VKRLAKEQQRYLVRVWDKAGPELERIRREELRGLPYRWEDVDALLEMGDHYDGPRRLTSGLIEMQRQFMELARKQGLLPAAVREESATYGGAGVPPAASAAGTAAPQRRASLRTVGDAAILDRPKIALFCSAKCPGKLILDTYDLCHRFRAEGVTVISGFHSPMEEECLRILLRSPNPVIWCLARGMLKRIPTKPVDCRRAVADGRLVMVTPFPAAVRRITAETATTRNRLVADLASVIVVAHAARGSKIEALSLELLAAGKPVHTFDHPANAAIVLAGARPVSRLTDWRACI